MQVKNPARQNFSMKTIIETIIETIKFWEEIGMDYRTREEIEAETKAELQKQGKLDLVK